MVSKAETVDAFLAEQTPVDREIFAALRKLIRAAAPVAVESMKFRMPSYLLGDTPLFAFNRQKNYLCLYVDPKAVALFKGQLKHLDVGQSCIRFKTAEDLPLPLARKILLKAAQLHGAR